MLWTDLIPYSELLIHYILMSNLHYISRCTEYELSAKRQLQLLSQPSEKVEERVKEVEVCCNVTQQAKHITKCKPIT